MGTTYVYDVDKTAILVALVPVVGFAGDRCKVAFNSDQVETIMGTDGNGRHVMNRDKSGTVTITLEHGSPSNAAFEILRMTGQPFPILVKDNSSVATLFATADAMVKKQPDLGLGKQGADLDWVFTFINGQLMHSAAKEY